MFALFESFTFYCKVLIDDFFPVININDNWGSWKAIIIPGCNLA